MSTGLCSLQQILYHIDGTYSFVDHDMVMRYHWGLGVGHAYTHGQGISNEILQNQTSERDEHDKQGNDQCEDVHYSILDLLENSEDEATLDQNVNNDGSNFGSESVDSSLDDNFEDYDILDYQN